MIKNQGCSTRIRLYLNDTFAYSGRKSNMHDGGRLLVIDVTFFFLTPKIASCQYIKNVPIFSRAYLSIPRGPNGLRFLF